MKKKHSYLFISFVFLLISCESKKNIEVEDYDYQYDDYTYINSIIPEKVMTDTFLGDFDPIKMEDLIFLQKSKKTMKPKQILSTILVPRTNCIQMQFRDTANLIIISLDKKERDMIIAACNTFISQYEERSIPHHKINSKTAYFSSRTYLSYGIISASTVCSQTNYYINCEFIDKKPYLLIKFVPTRSDNGNFFTPKIELYLSPAQVRNFIEYINQETLNSYVKTLNDKAYTY